MHWPVSELMGLPAANAAPSSGIPTRLPVALRPALLAKSWEIRALPALSTHADERNRTTPLKCPSADARSRICTTAAR